MMNIYEGGIRDLHSILNKLMIRVLQKTERDSTEDINIKNLDVLSDLDKKLISWNVNDCLERYSSPNTMIGMAVNSALQIGSPIQINMRVEECVDSNNSGEQLLVNTEDSPTKLSATISYQYIKSHLTKTISFISPLILYVCLVLVHHVYHKLVFMLCFN